MPTLNRSESFVSYTDQTGSEVFELVDSDENEDDSLLAGPVPIWSSLRDPATDENDTEEEELPDFQDLHRSQSLFERDQQPSSQARSETRIYDDSTDDCFTPVSRKRKSPLWEDTTMSVQVESVSPVKSKRPRRDPEEVQLEKERKAVAKREEAERKKAEKAEEKARKAAEKANEKLGLKAHKAINKLVKSRSDTLSEMTVEIHPKLCERNSAFHAHLQSLVNSISEQSKEEPRMKEVPSWPISRMKDDPQLTALDNLIRWKRLVRATYSEEDREWQAVPERYYRMESTCCLYYPVAALLDELRIPTAGRNVSTHLTKLRAHLGHRHQIFLLIDQASGDFKKASSANRERLETWLTELQVEYGCFVVRASEKGDVVSWLWNLTADLGYKPHKLIERSHLPFCPNANRHYDATNDGRRTKTLGTTAQQMLHQLYRVTENMADSITQPDRFPTLRSFFEAYGDPNLPTRTKQELLCGIPMGRKAGGTQNSQRIGPIISKRFYEVFTSEDALQLVGKGDKR